MKLIIQADDYGITEAVSDGICACARHNAMTQTGLFSNMPGAKYAAKRLLREYPQVSLGQDINLCCGYPVTDPKLIPSLVQNNGEFLTSKMHRVKELELNKDKIKPGMSFIETMNLDLDSHVKYAEAYLETENQVKRFIEICGKKPSYIGGHAYSNKVINRAMIDVAHKYDILLLNEFFDKIGYHMDMMEINPWYAGIKKEDGSIDFGHEVQFNTDLKSSLKNGEWEFLKKSCERYGWAFLHTHAGFCDQDLFRKSSYTFIRSVEADLLMSEEWAKWMRENDVELITIEDLVKIYNK